MAMRCCARSMYFASCAHESVRLGITSDVFMNDTRTSPSTASTRYFRRSSVERIYALNANCAHNHYRTTIRTNNSMTCVGSSMHLRSEQQVTVQVDQAPSRAPSAFVRALIARAVRDSSRQRCVFPHTQKNLRDHTQLLLCGGRLGFIVDAL